MEMGKNKCYYWVFCFMEINESHQESGDGGDEHDQYRSAMHNG